MTLEEIVAFAEEALGGLSHRRIDFDLIEAAEALRDGFEARGWKAFRLLWMRHEGALPRGPALAVEVSYDAVDDLRVAWHREDFPDQDPAAYVAQSREVALRRGAQVLARREGRALVAFAQLERESGAAEITQVYVHPEYRGAGRGTALTARRSRRRRRKRPLDRRRRRKPAEEPLRPARFSRHGR
jgi:ribosomal protein S18 acetylase RimI-like enzyme